jgi:hypothetical protein
MTFVPIHNVGNMTAISKLARPNVLRLIKFRDHPAKALSAKARAQSNARLIKGLTNAGLLVDELPVESKKKRLLVAAKNMVADIREIVKRVREFADGTYRHKEYLAVHGPIPEEVRRKVTIYRR